MADQTIERNQIRYYRSLIEEYEQVKDRRHSKYRFVNQFYKDKAVDFRTFLKFYSRFKASGNEKDLLPRTRGPRYKTRRTLNFIEEKVIQLRSYGNNRYEIHYQLKDKLNKYTPSATTIYNICKRYNMNRLTKTMKKNKRKIVKQKAGELIHIDCHHLPKGIVEGDKTKYYLVGVLDDFTRISWVELVEDIKAITVMFTVMKIFNLLSEEYSIKALEVITDNGAEFGGSSKKLENKKYHPFERMLLEMGVKHRFTKPYRPQTNGKIERFWKTLKADLIEDAEFTSLDDFKKELVEYMYYYNHMRPHQGIENEIPAEFNKNHL